MDAFGGDDAYISELSALSLKQLRDEPARLAALRAALNDKIQALSLENYTVHVENHNCGKTVRTEVSLASASLRV